MIGYVLWLLAGVLLGVWLAPLVHAAKAAAARRLREPDLYFQEGDVPAFRDDDPTGR